MQEAFVGIVKWFNAAKGYGFVGKCAQTTVWPDNSNADIFVHYSGIVASGFKNLSENDIVQFSIEEGKEKRLQATQVTLLKQNETTAKSA